MSAGTSAGVSRAYWVAAPGRGELREAPVRAPAAGEVAVRARASGISRGTESLVFRGAVPESQHDAMRCPFQEGDFPAPVKYGYAMAGETEDGARAFCLYPHQDRFVVPRGAVVPIPDDVPDRRAVMAANMETAVNALWDAPPCIGDRIAVVGGGVVGCFIAALAARHPAARVELVDVNPRREKIAAAFGAHCLDLNRVVGPGTVDGLHFDPESLQPVATALAQTIRGLLGEK